MVEQKVAFLDTVARAVNIADVLSCLVLKSWLFVTAALIVVSAMIALDWGFPTSFFYSPASPTPNESVFILLRFKRSIEIVLSLTSFGLVAVILRLRTSTPAQKGFACVALGLTIGFWLHRDLFYLLVH